ncbi:MAG: HAMP domain-containing protein, partial [Desulfobacterales bacterium]|nr:HAMP domain-containing protein [Desulfobacterales bacterium]
LGITQKFGMIIGTVLTLIISLTGLHFHIMAASNSRTESDLAASAHIQGLVLQMDAGLERARRLKKEFSLKYAGYDRFDPDDDFARQIHAQLLKVSELSDQLRSLIDQSNVSEALQESHINLNLYFSMAVRCRSVFTEMVELVRQQTRSETGLLFRFLEIERNLSVLIGQTGNPVLISLFQDCRLHAKDYIVTRQRPAMQSVMNAAFFLRKAVADSSAISDPLKTRIKSLLTDHRDIAKKIPSLDSRIRSKSNEFDLNTDTLESVSADLIRLVNLEIEATRAKSRRTVTLLGRILVLSALGGILLVGLLALVIHHTITRHIQGLTLAASRLQEGDLDVRAHLESNDELGQLSKGFNRMADQLRHLISDLETQVLKRTQDLEASNLSLQREIEEKEKLALDLRQAHKMEAVGTLSGGI